MIRVGDSMCDLIERHDRAGKFGRHSGIRNRGRHSNRTGSNRTGSRRNRNRNIRTGNPSPTIPESRSHL